MTLKTIITLITIIYLNSFSFAQIKVGKLKIPIPSVPTKSGGSNNSSTASNLSESQIASGLKEALTIGAKNASQQLNAVDGFNKNMRVRVPFPEDCQKVATKLREMGFGKKVDEFELTLNRAAEDAAKEAAPIFVNAITSMTLTDAKNILTGPDTAATGYLRKTSYNSLFSTFSPHISSALQSNLATKKWAEITALYNKIPTVKKVDTDLVRYTTNKALKGLFVVVADEELKIRKNPSARVTDLLKQVFGSK